jgi:hypothetical protein
MIGLSSASVISWSPPQIISPLQSMIGVYETEYSYDAKTDELQHG